MRVAVLAAAGVAAAASCSFSTVINWDLNGGDLPNQPASKALTTAAECAALCCSTSACNGYSLNAGAPGTRWCYLKSGGWTNTSSPGVESGAAPPAPPNTSFPWFNASLPIETRVALLVGAMTLDEQISWLNDASPAIPRLGLPAYSWEAESLHGVAWAGVATVFPSNIAWAASFDVPLVSAIGNVVAVEARAKWLYGLATDGSSAEFHGLNFMTPNNNVAVDQRWGRLQETYGEDPVLVSAMTEAHIAALQADASGNSAYLKTLATSKHFLSYHIESLGTDGQARLSHSWNVTETDIQQTYLPPFAAAARAGVASYMCAYDGQNGTNPAWPHPSGPEPWGVPMCLNTDMQRLLRGQLNFTGFIISDEGAITFAGPGYHDYTNTVRDAACLAMNAGTDLALGGEYASTLGSCVAGGNVTAARIAQALTRTLTAHFRLGWFDTLAARARGTADPVPYNNVTFAANVSSPDHRALSAYAAREGLVLLKNDAGILPLDPAKLGSVALIGPAADFDGTATSSYVGSYSACEDSPGGDVLPDPGCHVVTLLEALTNASATYGFHLAYAAGTDINTVNATGIPAAVAAAAGSDVIVAAVGLNTCQETYCSEGEANDRGRGADSAAPTLDLPGSQLALLQALQAAYPSTPIILCVFNGGPVSSPSAYAAAAGVLMVWYPGYEGGSAIVDALFGSYSPAGRLPVTMVTDESELPPVTDFIMSTAPGRTHRYYTGVPLYPFGFGLSYASFTYSSMDVSPPVLSPSDDSFVVSAVVTHSGGKLASDEVVQVYGAYQANSTGVASYPLQQLLAFTRLHDLQPGSATPVSLSVPRSALTLMSPGGVMQVAPGMWAIYIGGGPPSNTKYGGGAVLVSTLTVQPEAMPA